MEVEHLKELWIGHGFVGADKLYGIAKAKGMKMTLAQVKDFIKSQEVAQLHKQPKKEAEIPITVDGKRTEYQMDLMDESAFASQNRGYRWILAVENIWSRKGSCIPCKSKSPNDVLIALKQAIDELGGKPVQIVSDSGTEWMGAVKKWMDEEQISHRTVEVGTHTSLGVIDSFIKYVKNSIHRNFTHSQKTNWIDYLPMLIQNYNNSPHSSLKAHGQPALTPIEGDQFETDVRNIHVEKVYAAQNKRKPSELAVGDHVRVSKRKEVFGRGYSVRYSIEVFKIEKIEDHWFILNNGKRYREGSLQKVDAPIEKEEVKDVAKEAKFEHQTEQILKHKEGVSQLNRREGLRERAPQSQLEHSLFGRINWS